MRLAPVRLAAVALATGGAPLAGAQVWEKLIAPGLTYRMELDLGTPRVVHALRFSPGSETVVARPELARGAVFSDDPTQGRATLSEIALETGALGGVNADFFPFTGDPLGLMVRDGEMFSAAPGYRSAFAWGPRGAAIAVPSFRGTLYAPSREVALDGFNEECAPDKVVLNTDRVGLVRMRGMGAIAVVKVLAGAWTPSGSADCEVVSMTGDAPVRIERGFAAIAAAGNRSGIVGSLKPGDRVKLEWETTGFDWSSYTHAIGGGPCLVREGKLALDWAEQRFNLAFATQRHPRTAIGVTKGGDIWFVTIDGRQAASAGATLEETARIMLRLGCVGAINLDGGGSTTLHLLGLTLNRPSDGRERPISNGVFLFRAEGEGAALLDGAGTAAGLSILAPATIMSNQTVALSVTSSTGALIPNREVVWVATGDAWVDQGGMLRPLRPGRADVFAWCRGVSLSAKVEITPGSKS